MNKVSVSTLLICSSLFLSACQSATSPTSTRPKQETTLKVASSKDKRLPLIEGMADEVFLFDYQLAKKSNSIEIWRDEYQAGELVESYRVIGEEDPSKNGQFIYSLTDITTTDEDEGEGDVLFNFSVVTASGAAKVSALEKWSHHVALAVTEIEQDQTGSYPFFGLRILTEKDKAVAGLSLSETVIKEPGSVSEAEMAEGKLFIYRLKVSESSLGKE